MGTVVSVQWSLYTPRRYCRDIYVLVKCSDSDSTETNLNLCSNFQKEALHFVTIKYVLLWSNTEVLIFVPSRQTEFGAPSLSPFLTSKGPKEYFVEYEMFCAHFHEFVLKRKITQLPFFDLSDA